MAVTTSAIIATAAVIGAAATATNAYNSYQADKSARKAQKAQQREQAMIQGEQEAQALDQRKAQINQMREQIGGGGYSTSSTGAKGVKGRISRGGGDTLG